ncbi:MAG TPA: Asp-tRNA(Asn)/Glu-tRNA(Gln) amidotransferase subunit GatC [Euzebyales bacterium]
MSLSIDDVRHVANLARVALDDDHLEQLRSQLERILGYAEQIGEVATEDVPPTSHPYPLTNVWRPDEVRPSLTPDEARSTGPAIEDGRFRVPRIIDEDA